MRFHQSFLVMSSGHQTVLKNSYFQSHRMAHGLHPNIKMDGYTSYCVVNAMPADSLAPLGSRLSAGTALTKFGSHIVSGPAHEE